MSINILIELRFFSFSILNGIFLMFIYDSFRILRRIKVHNVYMAMIEDIFFWLWASFRIFKLMYLENNGIIRVFSILGILLGMMFYNISISNFYVNKTAKLLNKIIAFGRMVVNKVNKFVLLRERDNEEQK